MSWGKKPEQKRREKEYNRLYYLKRKKKNISFPMINDHGGYQQTPHGNVVTGQVPLSWAHQHAMETISQMTFKDHVKDVIKSIAYSLEDEYPQYSNAIHAGFEFVQKILKD